MDLSDNNYCRLCAELKPSSKLLNLQCEESKRQEIVEKLNRVNAATDFTQEYLPKSVCFVCVNKLNHAFDFVRNIEQAQGVLTNIFLTQEIKEEIQNSAFSDDGQLYDTSDIDQSELKDENIVVKQESNEPDIKFREKGKVKTSTNSEWDSSDNELKDKRFRRKSSKYKDSKNCTLDIIPLSQLKLTWKDYNWTCSFCETQFPTVDELKNHSIQYHDCCNAFRCTDCNARKLRLNKFIIHVQSHRKYLKLSCYKCQMRFSSSREVTSHEAEHRTSNHMCYGCNTTFLTIDELNIHTNSYYQARKARPIPEVPTNTEDLTCLLCKKTFKRKGSLHTHLLIHTERKRDHTCEKCGKCFLNKQNLAGHMILHDNVRPYQCEICKASFKTHNQLRNHVGVHDNKKPFACEQCGRCFRLQKQLTSHSIIHTDTLPHVCSFCNKGFRFKTILNQHIRQHTGFKPYSCSMCQRDFTNWPNYNKHMKRRHGMDMAKKKHTPDGVYPIDPVTGEIIVHTETSKILEWKKQIMVQRKPGRPKTSIKVEENVNDSEKVDNIEMGTVQQKL